MNGTVSSDLFSRVIRGAIVDHLSPNDMLVKYSADLGFDFISHNIRIPGKDFQMGWSCFEGEELASDDEKKRAIISNIRGMPKELHDWCRNRRVPFTSDDCIRINAKAYAVVMNSLRDFNRRPWRMIHSVPRVESGYWHSVALGHRERISDTARTDVTILANVCFDLRQFCVTREGRLNGEGRKLTDRQLDCVRWAIAGKTLADTSEILGISVRTVRYHLESVRNHYGYATTTQALVRAAKDYEIDPFDGRLAVAVS